MSKYPEPIEEEPEWSFAEPSPEPEEEKAAEETAPVGRLDPEWLQAYRDVMGPPAYLQKVDGGAKLAVQLAGFRYSQFRRDVRDAYTEEAWGDMLRGDQFREKLKTWLFQNFPAEQVHAGANVPGPLIERYWKQLYMPEEMFNMVSVRRLANRGRVRRPPRTPAGTEYTVGQPLYPADPQTPYTPAPRAGVRSTTSQFASLEAAFPTGAAARRLSGGVNLTGMLDIDDDMRSIGTGAVPVLLPRHPRAVRILRERHRPDDHDPTARHLYTYAKTLPGDHFNIFRKRNEYIDPLTSISCRGRKEEIGNFIQMCIGPQTTHIIIYKDASLKGLKILCKKLMYHVKRLKGSAELIEHGKGMLYTGAKLKVKKANNMASELFRLLKKRGRYLRLILTQKNMGGALREDWMHRPDAILKIGERY